MSTHPYIPLYVDDFEAATAHLSAEEDGVYNRLLRLAWRTQGCSLPPDQTWLARKLRLSPADFERVAGPILAEFFVLHRGRYVQRRLKAEYDDISRKKSVRQQAGKKGGDAKARKLRDNSPSTTSDLLPDTRAFQNHTHTHIQNHKEEGSVSEVDTAAASAAVGEDVVEECRAKPDPRARAWALAKRVLMDRGGLNTDKAGKIVGQWMRDLKLDANDLWDVALAAWRAGTQEPVAYMTAAFRDRNDSDSLIRNPSIERQVSWMEDFIEHPIQWREHERGPKPGCKGCQVTAEIQRKHGVAPFGELLPFPQPDERRSA